MGDAVTVEDVADGNAGGLLLAIVVDGAVSKRVVCRILLNPNRRLLSVPKENGPPFIRHLDVSPPTRPLSRERVTVVGRKLGNY
jgi:hypothetical protein